MSLTSRAYGSVVSTVNSTSATLGIGGVFTGVAEEVIDFAAISVFVFANQASAADGLRVEYSVDGTNWDDDDHYTIVASDGKFFTFAPEARFFRVVYTNGGVAQAAFRLQSILHRDVPIPSSHSLRGVLTDEEDAELVRAVIAGKKPDDTYTNALFDMQGRLVVAAASASATTAGFSDGKIASSAGAGTEVVIRATVYTEPAVAAQRSIVSTSAADAAAGTGARTARITYFDGTLAGPFTETLTLNGTTPVNTVNTDIRFIEKIEVLTAGTSTVVPVGTVSLMTGTGGAGTAIWTIAPGDGKTFGAHHYVPSGTSVNITGLAAGTRSSGATFRLKKRSPTISQTFDVQLSDNVRVNPDSFSFRAYGTPLVLTGPVSITAYATVDAAGAKDLFASFDFYEE